MPTENEVATTATEVNESIQAGYDRIANPDKAQEEPKSEQVKIQEPVEEATAETAASSKSTSAPEFTNDQIQEVMATLARIPKLEKQLNDTGGRYGALKQSLEQLQQRMAAPAVGEPVDVESMLKDIKDEFGDDGLLYQTLKAAFSKVLAGRQVDSGAIEKVVSEKIAAAKQAEFDTALEQLTEAHPNWRQDRETPEFKDWVASLPDKVRNRFMRSTDPDFVAEKLDEFNEWKAKKKALPAQEKEPPVPAKKEAEPSKRLLKAVLPTNGTKPKATGEDNAAASIRAGYERVAKARMR